MKMETKIISWNVNGLNAPSKRKKIVYWLSKQKYSVVCLQEVHLKKADNKYLKQKSLGLEFYSLAMVKKRGVVFYIKEELKPEKNGKIMMGGCWQ